MSLFPINTVKSAPITSQEILAATERAVGFIPNMHGIMAESPVLLKAYKELGKLFNETSFSAVEREIIEMTINQVNGCTYCIAAHSYFNRLSNFPKDILHALLENRPLEDPKLQILRIFTKTLIEKRGWILPDEIETFLSSGYSKEQVLELIVGVAHKIMSNYVNHIAETPIDEKFK